MKSNLNVSALILLLTFLINNNLLSQVSEQWFHRYTGPESSTDSPNDICFDQNGNLYLTGKSILSGGYSDMITVKFSAAGERQWISKYDGASGLNDDGIAIVADGSGNIYAAGSTKLLSGQYDMILIKYDQVGSQMWVQTYNGPGNFDDMSAGVATDQNGDIYLAGYSYGSGTSYDFVLIKYNSTGNLQWTKRWNGSSNSDDYIKKIAVNSNNEIIVTGSTYDNSSSFNFITICYNTSGNVVWNQIYNSSFSSSDEVTNLKIDQQNNVYVCGKSVGSGAGYDYAVVKYNSVGVQQWVSRYDGISSSDDVANAVDADAAGNVYVTGYSYGNSSFYDFATVKFNSAGVLQWAKTYNGNQNYFDKAIDVKVDGQGNLFVTGNSIRQSDGTSDVVLINYNSSGSVQWTKLYNGPGDLDDIAIKAKSNAGGNILILSSSYSYFLSPLCGSSDYLVLNYNPGGNLDWQTRFDGSGTGADEAASIIIDNNGNSYVTGYSYDKVSNDDFATMKYNSTGAPQWVSRYDANSSIDRATGISTDQQGNTFVTGTSMGSGSGFDIVTIKNNSNAGQTWLARYNGPANGDEYSNSVTVDASGNVYVSGYGFGTGSANDYVTLKYNSSGTQQWASRYNGPGNSNDISSAMVIDNSGNTYVTGTSSGSGTGRDIATVKYNSSGSQMWVMRYNGAANDSDAATSIALDSNGNVIVAGKTKSLSSAYDVITLKYNSSGVLQWAVTYDGTAHGNDEGNAIATDAQGNIYVAGSSKNAVTNIDYSTLKYSSSGVLQWIKNYNGSANSIDKANAIALDVAGNVYITGFCNDVLSNMNYCTIKYNSIGKQSWLKKYNHIDNDSDKATSVKVDTEGNVYVTGTSKSLEGKKDFCTIRYKQDKMLEMKSLIEGLYDENLNSMIPDTIKVLLRNNSSPYAVEDSAVSFTDGSGLASYYFYNVLNGVPYYIAIIHRNSIETWSAAGSSFQSAYLNYDFTVSSSQAYGNNLKQKGSKFCIYSGDVNRDFAVDLSDITIIFNDVGQFASGYNQSDLNGDKIVDLSDLVICLNNSSNYVSVIRP